MPMKGLVFTVFLAVTVGVKHHGKHGSMKPGQTHKFGIEYLNSMGNKFWIVKDISVGKAIIDYLSKRTSEPVIPKVSGYRGYKINHKINGISTHNWLLVKCEHPSLEIAIIEHSTSKRDVPPLISFKETLNKKCTSKKKQT